MKIINRREFIKTAGMGGAALFSGVSGRAFGKGQSKKSSKKI
jgi:hypothetical protein